MNHDNISTLMPLDTEEYRCLVTRPLADALRQRSLVYFLAEGATLKNDKKRRTAVIQLPEIGPVFTKIYFESGFFDGVKSRLLGSAARNGHQTSAAFTRHGLRTPLSLGYLESRSALFSGSIHFSGFLESGKTFWQQLLDTPEDQGFWIKSAFQQLALLHNRGLVHGDLKLHNLMVKEQKLYYIDLDSAFQSTNCRARSKDVARFLVGLSEADVPLAPVRQAFAEYCQLLNLDHQIVMPYITRFAGQVQRKHQLKYNRQPRAIL